MAEPQQSNDSAKPQTLSPPIMKIDAPAEETSSKDEDNTKNECVVENETFKICSPSTNASSQPGRQAKTILKPPQLSLNTGKTFVLNPSKLNPFGNKSDSKDTCDKKVNGETVKFVPLVQTEPKTATTTKPPAENVTVTASTTFVFGQNLQDRVVSAEGKPEDPEPSTSLNSNGTTELLFSSVINSEIKPETNNTSKETKSLSESAREYEESRANKRKYDEVEVITGEEEETNVLSISCKLFSYDNTGGTWQERGRGILRLNDLELEDNRTQSRLVFRTSGSLRVILNTKIWAEMMVDKASEKSIRLTAQDSSGGIKVFLIMASNEDSKHLFKQLQTRLQREISSVDKRRKTLSNSDSGGQ
ncbi:ran-binding protein 3 isoform X2 [Aethina tumida]|uniref:ran-binding protein 3 isoform X2 n=1 Tax=Aethina tumida TaxID=116153 RepID=UPI0021484D3F|nr:ran-binding protein 3 isoform X2 [Aethina tumida]